MISTTTTVPVPLVFEVLMSAQDVTSLQKEKMTKKDKLYKAVLEFIAKEKPQLKS